jgi:hypothetical protein
MKNGAFEFLAIAGAALVLVSCGGAESNSDSTAAGSGGQAGASSGARGAGGQSQGGAGGRGEGGAGGPGVGGVGGQGGNFDPADAGGGSCSGSSGFRCVSSCFTVESPAKCVNGHWDCLPPTPVRTTSCPFFPMCGTDSPNFDCCNADGVRVPSQCTQTDTPFYSCPTGAMQVPKGTCKSTDGGRDGSAASDAAVPRG